MPNWTHSQRTRAVAGGGNMFEEVAQEAANAQDSSFLHLLDTTFRENGKLKWFSWVGIALAAVLVAYMVCWALGYGALHTQIGKLFGQEWYGPVDELEKQLDQAEPEPMSPLTDTSSSIGTVAGAPDITANREGLSFLSNPTVLGAPGEGGSMAETLMGTAL